MPALIAPRDIPITPGADAARAQARRELSDPIYTEHRPSVLEQLGQWILERLDDLVRAAASASPGGTTGLGVLLVAIVAVVVVVRWRLGALARAARAGGAVLGPSEHTADEHRRAADEHAAAGRYDDAVRERMRALVRALEERTVLAPRRGRTAGEAAREAGARLPSVATPLAEAARLFDETIYGGRPATSGTDARMRAADDEVRAAPTAAV